MGQERNFSDFGIGISIGLFVLGCFVIVLGAMDVNTNNSENLNSYISTPYNSSQASLKLSAYQLEQITFNGSQYQIKDTQQIDTRGTGEAESNIKSSKTTIKSFFNNALLKSYDIGGILVLILGLIITAGGVLLFRIMIGRNRI